MARPDEWDSSEAEPDAVPSVPGPDGATEETPAVVGDEWDEQRSRARPSLAYFGTAAILLGKVLVARWLILGPGAVLTASLQEAVLVLALLGIVDLLFSKRRFAAYLVVDVTLSVFLIALTEYVAFYERMLDPGALRYAGQVGAVGPSLMALLSPAFVLYLADFPLIAVFNRPLREIAGSGRTASHRLKFVMSTAIALAVFAVTWALLAPAGSDGVAVARRRGLLAYETSALARVLGGTGVLALVGVEQSVADPAAKTLDYSDPESVQRVIDQVSRRGERKRIADFEPGAYSGAHVIVIQVESLQGFAVNDWVTPNLNRLASESWYFPNGFSQSGLGTTSDAEFAMNSSLYPPTDDPASVAYVNREIPALPRLLGEQAYYTFTMHANTIRFWNRKELYPSLGFADFYDRSYFGQEKVIGMGTSDRQFFKKALPIIVTEASSGPIYCQLVTITPHHPFKMPRGTVKIDLPPWLAGSAVGNYLEAMNYEDRQIGYFVDQLKKAGLWDKSIVVVYGDHAGLRMSDLDENSNLSRVEQMIDREYNDVDRANVPILIHLPGQTTGVLRTSAAGQVDIMPTIADALGLDLSDVPHFGRSLFESSRPLLIGRSGLSPGSFVNERIVCVARDDLMSSDAYSVSTRKSARIAPEDSADWDAVRSLSAISHAYVQTLPERESGGVDGAIMPRKKRTP